MPYATEIHGSFLGQTIPEGIRCFDCRRPIGTEFQVAPWTYTIDGEERPAHLIGSEAAQVDLGLRTKHERFAFTPCSGSGYGDTRYYDNHRDDAIRDMFAAAVRVRDEYNRMIQKPASTDGGGVYYKPIAAVLNNFGWTLISDERTAHCVSLRS